MGAQQRQKCRVTRCQSWKGPREGQRRRLQARVSPYPQGRSPTFGLPLPGHPPGAPSPDGSPPPQINLNESMQVVSRKVVTVAYGEPVHHVMQFDPADPGYLYLMTSHQVRPEPPCDEVPGRAELSCLPCLCTCCCSCWERLRPHPPACSSAPRSAGITSAGKPCSLCFPHYGIEPQFPQPLTALAVLTPLGGAGSPSDLGPCLCL